jgi:hypothetical protein
MQGDWLSKAAAAITARIGRYAANEVKVRWLSSFFACLIQVHMDSKHRFQSWAHVEGAGCCNLQFNLMACIEDRRQKYHRELAQQQYLQVSISVPVRAVWPLAAHSACI